MFRLNDTRNTQVQLGKVIELDLFGERLNIVTCRLRGCRRLSGLQGFLGGMIFLIMGIQGAVFWGLVMVILSVIPAVGTGLVWGPTAIFLFIDGSWIKSLILVAYGVLVIGLVDNLLRPILVGRDTKMPDYLILFSTLGGLSLFGITGFVLGPVIAALFLATWRMYGEEPAFLLSEPNDQARSTTTHESPDVGES